MSSLKDKTVKGVIWRSAVDRFSAQGIQFVFSILIARLLVPEDYGVVAMCYGSLISSIICLIWNTHYTKKLIGYGFFAQRKDLLPIILHAVVMGLIVAIGVHFMPTLWLILL